MSTPAVPDVSGDWFAAMRSGRWEDAWRATDRIEHERRRVQAQPGFAWRPEYLRWDGTPLHGREVMVRCDHGLGDTMQFLRFVPLLGAARIHLMVQPHLLDLLAGAPGLGQVHDWWTDRPPPPHEVEIEVMELPYALRTTLATLPPPYPHLRAQVARVPPPGLARDGKLRVGLLWAASDWDGSRSVPLHALQPLLDVPGVRFYALQQGPAADDAAPPLENLAPRTRSITHAAAAMCELDLVISIDGMPAHRRARSASPPGAAQARRRLALDGGPRRLAPVSVDAAVPAGDGGRLVGADRGHGQALSG
ncbi:hypothetical protein HK414_05195 [Ramlibacter terrae]|uniref:Uncharacterized protein n=1 Tax=Ramlibacter terrae TaxID=2732511 RepID=A0ABX6P0T5_9BURK|nr:hypothetical protein HK414_05195 [Ramlibacter terrae]